MKKYLHVLGVLILWLAVLSVNTAVGNTPIQVEGFTLMDADTDIEIVNITDGDVINLAELPSRNINIRANTQPNTLPLQIGSVVFTLNKNKRIENQIPFALQGDILGNYNAWTPALGNYELSATPFTESGGNGIPGQSLSIRFKVIDKPLNLLKAVYRINAGGPDYITPKGEIFKKDNYFFSSHASYSTNVIKKIKGSKADGLYLTEHISDRDLGQFYYYMPVAAGNYTVKLHFAEIFFGVEEKGDNYNPIGKRVFDVDVDGQHKLTNFDIAAEVGVAKALVKTFEVASNDGNIVIGFSGKVNRPKISAIEILKSIANNKPPVANAGENKLLRLPETSTTLVGTWSDKDGYVTKVQWTQVSGPPATMKGITESNLEVSNLIADTYIFRLTVTDNDGATDSDDVALVVIAAPEKLKISVYPNPIVEILNISTNTDTQKLLNIRLFNRFGILTYESLGLPVENNFQVDVSSLPSNIYLLQVESEGTIETFRIIKE